MTNGTETNGQRNVTQWITVAVSVAVVLASGVGAYVGIQSELREHRATLEEFKTFQKDQRDYNKELRDRIAKADEEIRASIRMLVIKLLDDKGKP